MDIKGLIGNIFFKLFIGLLVLSFAFFGVSSFLFSGSNSWVAKVDGKKIDYYQLQNTMKINRETILRQSNNSERALQYVESTQFMSDSLGKLVNKEIVKKLSDTFGIDASRKLIMEAIANDNQFKYNGKFDRRIFANFLSQNGFDEDSYIRAVQDEIVAAMIVNSLSSVSPVDGKIVKELAEMKGEKRIADVVVVSTKNIGKIPSPKDEELQAIYEKNKGKFLIPEFRKVQYLSFSGNVLSSQKARANDTQIAAEYESNKELYKEAEKRDFYHMLFEEEEKAEIFLEKLEEKTGQDLAKNFIETAKKVENRDEKSLLLQNTKQQDLIPEIGNVAFKLKKNQYSPILTSPLGYHILLLKEIKPSDYVPLAKVKNDIKKQLEARMQEDLLQNKTAEIENLLITSNSLQEVASKLKLGVIKSVNQIDQKGLDQKGREIKEAKLEDFVKNVFANSSGKTSPLYFDKEKNLFYAIKIDEIKKSYVQNFDEVKSELKKFYAQEQQTILLKKLANEIADEIKNNPDKALQIAAKKGLRTVLGKEYPREYVFDFQGQRIPYSDKFLEELFAIKVGQVTSPFSANAAEFNIGILKKIKQISIKETDVILQKEELANENRKEILEIFNNFLQKKYPIQVNEKFLKQITEEKNNGV